MNHPLLSAWGWVSDTAKINLPLINKCHKTSIKICKQNKTEELPENPTQAPEKWLGVPRGIRFDAKDYLGMDLCEIIMFLSVPEEWKDSQQGPRLH